MSWITLCETAPVKDPALAAMQASGDGAIRFLESPANGAPSVVSENCDPAPSEGAI